MTKPLAHQFLRVHGSTHPPHPKTWHLWQSLRRAYPYSRIRYETQGCLQMFQQGPMPTCAQNVATIRTLPTNARQRLEEQRWENHPRYARGLVWTDNDPTHTTLAAYTEIMPALPSAPTNELNNPVAHATIRLHPHLFQLITPINIDCLESLLTTHPNQALVCSIILGF